MTHKNMIPMFRPYITQSAIERVVKTLESGYIGEGPVVKELEDRFSELVGNPYNVALNSGTSALYLALALSGVGPGDEVITTAQTMMATSHAIIALGGRPVFADIQYLTGNIDPKDIEHRITKKTKVILPVHWAGYPCDMEEISKIASSHSISVIEDAAHAIGARYKGKSIGDISEFTCFSFQAIKHITTGDGGMLSLKHKKDYESAKRRKWFGIDRDNRKPDILGEPLWNVTEIGYKLQMNDIAASLGVENIKDLGDILKRRHEIVKRYRKELFDTAGITLFEVKKDSQSADWLFSMHVEKREDFIRMMKSKSVSTSVVHLRIDRNNIFGGIRKDLPNLDKFTDTLICLPLHNHLTDEDVHHILGSIKEGW